MRLSGSQNSDCEPGFSVSSAMAPSPNKLSERKFRVLTANLMDARRSVVISLARDVVSERSERRCRHSHSLAVTAAAPLAGLEAFECPLKQ
jgi:hypothetical protein